MSRIEKAAFFAIGIVIFACLCLLCAQMRRTTREIWGPQPNMDARP